MSERTLLQGSTVAGWLGVEYYLEADGRVTGSAILGEAHEGPPQSTHGGLLVTLLDEAMGSAAWCAGYAVVTANLNIDFRARASLNTPLTITAWVAHTEGRKIHTAGNIALPDGSLVLEGQGLFIDSPQLFMDAPTTLRTPRTTDAK